MLSILSSTTETEMAPEEYPAETPKIAPMHPGQIIGGVLSDQRISLRKAAAAIGVSHNALANVVAGKSAVTAEMALRIGKYFGNGAELWLRLQQDYDLWHAEKAERAAVTKIRKLEPIEH